MDWNKLVDSLVNWATTSGLRILIALIILFVTFKIINAIGRKIERTGQKRNADKTIMKTLAYIFRLGCKVIVAICLVGYVGVNTSGLTALITSLGVCVGLAVNGTLSNLAGGVMIILTRPFKLDDYIEAQGKAGTVVDIRITNTKLLTPDNKVIYIPNGALSTGDIVNYSEKDTRRVDLTFSIGYADDSEKAKQIIRELCDMHDLVLKDPAPFVRMGEHAASSINITTRVWVKSADYWTVYFDLLEQVKAEFDKQGIEIPFEQVDVHIKKD
ncbi:MAG: mechanosensitive ion channel [Clostridiales bacterium]|nr:mechanosensitive ion channel [Clostridiales bacterium]